MVEQHGYSLEHITFQGKPSSSQGRRTGHSAVRVSAIDGDPVHAFVALVLKSAGLPADAYRAAPMHRRLSACLRALKAGSIPEALSMLPNPQSVARATDALLIGVTEFFRDAKVFDALRNFIAADPAIRQAPIRVWSAGCSNGAELVSLAILLAEADLLDRSTLLGTDCRAAAIQEAQAGVYTKACVQSMDASLRQKYMRYAGGQWRVEDCLSRCIRWRVCDLLSSNEDGPWDIILWRNMSIYLRLKPSLQVWERLIKALRPGGLLVVGNAERPPRVPGLTYIGKCIYQLRREGSRAVGC
jgi:chemotaxis protein methyltransferase CheR